MVQLTTTGLGAVEMAPIRQVGATVVQVTTIGSGVQAMAPIPRVGATVVQVTTRGLGFTTFAVTAVLCCAPPPIQKPKRERNPTFGLAWLGTEDS